MILRSDIKCRFVKSVISNSLCDIVLIKIAKGGYIFFRKGEN